MHKITREQEDQIIDFDFLNLINDHLFHYADKENLRHLPPRSNTFMLKMGFKYVQSEHRTFFSMAYEILRNFEVHWVWKYEATIRATSDRSFYFARD